MNTPPLLLAAALLCWGWQTGWLPLALLLAAVVEAPRLLPSRWELTQSDLDRIWNLCTILFLGAAVYALAAGDERKALLEWAQNSPGARSRAVNLMRTSRSVFLFFQWMPLCFAPIIIAQAWNVQRTLPLSTFSWWLRRNRRAAPSPERSLNISYGYFAVCILAASAAHASSPIYFAVLALLIGWALWPRRPAAHSIVAWAASFVIALALGLALQRGLVSLQAAIQNLDNYLASRWTRSIGFDPKESRTRLGARDTLKPSGRIVLRVKPESGPPPALLREAIYNQFRSTVWTSLHRDFQPLVPEPDETTWLLTTNQAASRWVRITGLLPGGKGLLPLPHATAELQNLPVFLLEANPMGLIRSAEGPGYFELRARFGKGHGLDDPPAEADRSVPTAEDETLTQIVKALDLKAKTPPQAITALRIFFTDQFDYSLEGTRSPGTNTALAQFLVDSKKGHCEYFATATVLLLRAAGIPARYAVGYAVQENKRGQYIIRERHAHAWCLAWVDGDWQEVDTTPASWFQLEETRASWWQPVADAWSACRFAFSKWRWTEGHLRRYVFWFLALLTPLFALQLFLSRQWRRARSVRRHRTNTARPWAGLESEFYQVEQRLARLGYARAEGETCYSWLDRLRASAGSSFQGLESLIHYHYRLRFDPAGLNAAERLALRRDVRHWLEQFELAPAAGASAQSGKDRLR